MKRKKEGIDKCRTMFIIILTLISFLVIVSYVSADVSKEKECCDKVDGSWALWFTDMYGQSYYQCQTALEKDYQDCLVIKPTGAQTTADVSKQQECCAKAGGEWRENDCVYESQMVYNDCMTRKQIEKGKERCANYEKCCREVGEKWSEDVDTNGPDGCNAACSIIAYSMQSSVVKEYEKCLQRVFGIAVEQETERKETKQESERETKQGEMGKTEDAKGIMKNDCSVNKGVFDRDWKKYSDIDERIPLQSRSWEAQQYERALYDMVQTEIGVIRLKSDMEIDRLIRVELREYRAALVKNLQTNILKAFWRLAYITQDTIGGFEGIGGVATGAAGKTKWGIKKTAIWGSEAGGGAIDLGGAYSKLFTDAEKIEKIGAGLKVIRGLSSKYQLSTKNITGKVASVGITGAIEFLHSKDSNPKKIGTEVAQEITRQMLPSPDLTPEEIEILRTQHLKKRIIDDAIQESYRANVERLYLVSELEGKVKELEQEILEWEGKEKERLKLRFKKNCRERKGEK